MENKRKTISNLFGPLLIFMLVSTAAAACMEMLWLTYLQKSILESADPVYAHTAGSLWACLRLVIPAGAGCFAVRREAVKELAVFSGFSGTPPEEEEASGRKRLSSKALPVLLTASAALSLGINVLAAVIAGGTDLTTSVPGAFPGLTGFIIQTVLYVIMMPYIEEILFRGILFSRFYREYGFRKAAVFSSAVFGLYHGTPAQAVYAFLMGLVFAAAYERTRRFQVPYALHGTCNLLVLVLQWTGAYGKICSPGWAAALFAVAAAGFYTIKNIKS